MKCRQASRVFLPGTYHGSMAAAAGFDWRLWSLLGFWSPCTLCSINRRSSRPGFGGLLQEEKEWRPRVLGSKFQMAPGNLLWWGSHWVSLSQSRIVFSSPRLSVAPRGQQVQTFLPMLPSLKTISPILTYFSYPWEGIEASAVPAWPAGGALLNQLILNVSPLPGQGCFLNKQKAVAEKCLPFTCVTVQIGPHYSKTPAQVEMHIRTLIF